MAIATLLMLLWARAWAAEPVLPVLEDAPPVAYPPEALAAGAEGVVGLELIVSAEGAVQAARVVVSSGRADLDAAAENAVATYRFRPALDAAGQPAPARIRYDLRFSLELAPPVHIEGVVREAGVRTPLEGVELRAVDAAGRVRVAETDAAGRYAFVGLEPGAWTVTAGGPALRAREEAVTVETGKVIGLDFSLVKDLARDAALNGGVLVIEGERESEGLTERRISTAELRVLPGTNGDVVRAVQNLPGVARPPLNIGQLIIRGTAPEDSRYSIDGSPIPIVFHFAGFSTVINSDSVAEVAYLPGNFSARYGRVLGGFVDLRTDDALPEKARGYASVDTFQATVFAEQKVGKRTALAISGRRSYIDTVLNPILQNAGLTFQAPRYWDAQVRVLHDAEDGGKFDAFAFVSDDRFRFLGQGADDEEQVNASLATTFQKLRLRYTRPLGGGWTNETSLIGGPERNFFEFTGGIEAFEKATRLGFRQEFARAQSEEQPLGWRLGLDIEGGTQAFLFDVGVPQLYEKGDSPFIAPAAYAEATARLGTVTLIPGLRSDFTWFADGGQGTSVDPRFAMRWLVGDSTTIKAASGLYSQYPTFRQVSTEADGTEDLQPSRAWQNSVGLRQQLGPGLVGEVSAFYNDQSRLVVGREERLRFFSGPPPAGPFDTAPYANDGVGRVYGGELFLRYDGTNVLGFLSATVSRSERIDRPGEDWQLFAFDQPIILNALYTQRLPRRWRVGARLRYGSGNPYTPVVNRVQDQLTREFEPVYGPRDSARLPPFYSLDLRVDKDYVFKNWTLTTYLDLQNATYAKNVEVISWTYDFAQEDPILSNPPLPAFGLRGEW